MKLRPEILAFILYLGPAHAVMYSQDTRTVSEPVIPPVCTVLKAQLSSGPTGLPIESESLLDTGRVQAALDACPNGQAVELRSDQQNNAFLLSPIVIKKSVVLLVDEDVIVFGSRNPRDYDADSRLACGTLAATNTGCLPLIQAYHADKAGLMGFGVIDGRGHLPMLINGKPADMSWWDLAAKAQTLSLNQNCPKLVQLWVDTNFTVYKITLKNSPFFHLESLGGSGLTVWGLKVIAPYDARNTDAVDLIYTTNVTVTNSFLSEGDDNIAVGGSSPGASNITVVDSHFGDGHGASIGNYAQKGINNVLFDRISFSGDTANANQIGIRIKSDVSTGGLVNNITYQNVCMQNVRSAIVVDPFYNRTATGSSLPEFRNIVLKNIHATTEGIVKIQGHDAAVPTSITLNNVQIDGVRSTDVTTQYTKFELGPDPVNLASMLTGTGNSINNAISSKNPPYDCPPAAFPKVIGELIPALQTLSFSQDITVKAQLFPAKALPYATYQTNLKRNPSATLDLPAPTGTITILDGLTAVGTFKLNGGRLFSIPLSHLAVGKHTLNATYSGDTNYPAISFGNYTLEVIDHFPSQTSLTVSSGNIVAGGSVTLTAMVTGTAGIPTGTVTFAAGDNQLATTTLDSNGNAQFNWNVVPGGSYVLTATYGGSSVYAAAAGPAVSVLVVPARSTTTVAPDAPVHMVGDDLVLSVVVAGTTLGLLVPSGTVDLFDGVNKLATVTLDATGAGSYTTNTLDLGIHSITCLYSGDATFVSSSSEVATAEIVDQPASSAASHSIQRPKRIILEKLQLRHKL